MDDGKYLGIDLGEKTIGLAVCDAQAAIAHPLTTLRRQSIKKDMGAIAALIDEHHVLAVIIGLPLNMNGSQGPMAQSVIDFSKRLRGRIKVPIHTWDERMTTLAAERSLIESDMRREKRREVVDQVAACFILQGWLDHQKREIL